MDEIDKRILSLLQRNDRISYKEIAIELQVAASTVHSRVKKLIKKKIIKNFSAILDPEKVGYHIIAWLGIQVDPLRIEEIAQELASYDEIQVVATSTGNHDIIAQVIAKDERTLWRFINENIKTIAGIDKKMDVSCFIDVYKKSHLINFF